MLRTLLTFVAVISCVVPSGAQLPDKDQIEANLKYRIVQIRDADVSVSDLTPSQFEGFHEGSFTINDRDTYRFLITGNPARLILLASAPLDVSLSSDAIAGLIEEEERKMEAEALDRHEALLRFASGMPARGPEDAPVTIFEFSDFQCPYCASATTILEELLEKRPAEVRVVYLHLPLSIHNWAMPAAVAATCAAEQDHEAFWLLHDRYFENQRSLLSATLHSQSKQWLEEGASIDMEAWESCANDENSAANQSAVLRVDVSVATAERMGASGTPAFFVNGHFLNGVQPIETFESLIDEILYAPQEDS